MRGGEVVAGAASPAKRRALFWAGLVVLMCASTALEWSRLYRFESFLPGHAGGVLGYITGPASVKWLGFTGSGLLGIVLTVLGLEVFLRVWLITTAGLLMRCVLRPGLLQLLSWITGVSPQQMWQQQQQRQQQWQLQQQQQQQPG